MRQAVLIVWFRCCNLTYQQERVFKIYEKWCNLNMKNSVT